tara:strand:+ start:1722 stop:2303 length:582 start_codon:yes stop_codon:yes gene_type:complete
MGRHITTTDNKIPFEYKFVYGQQDSGDIELFGGKQYTKDEDDYTYKFVKWDSNDVEGIENTLTEMKTKLTEFTNKSIDEWNDKPERGGGRQLWFKTITELNRRKIDWEEMLTEDGVTRMIFDLLYRDIKDINNKYTKKLMNYKDVQTFVKDNTLTDKYKKLLGLKLVMCVNLGEKIVQTVKEFGRLDVGYDYE